MRRTKSLLPLKKRSSFLEIAASGKKWVTAGVIVQIRQRPPADSISGGFSCFGLTTSKRVGNAVLRNRARRRLRALAHELLACHALPDYDYVLIARPETVTRSFEDLRNDIILSLKRLKVWRDEAP